MEVASGEYGEYTHKLMTAVRNGKCDNLGPDDDKIAVAVRPKQNVLGKKELYSFFHFLTMMNIYYH